MDPSLIQKLNPTLHEKSRLSIATALAGGEAMSFNALKELLGMTDGNLSVHIRTLVKKGYLVTAKCREAGGRTRTTCRLSDAGRKALRAYFGDLSRLLRSARAVKGRNGGLN